MGEPSVTHSNWTWRIGWFALGGAVLAVLIALIMATLARYDVIGKLPGFMWVFRSALIAAASAVIGLVVLVVGYLRRTGPRWPAGAGLALAVMFIAVLAAQIVPGMRAPPLHDITTDIDDPPEFETLTLREDNLVPFNNVGEWQALHRGSYPDIRPIVIEKAPREVLADARALAEQRGWEIASIDPEAGRMEATAFASYLRFRDDVVVTVTPIADGSTRVDMRSVSRVGVGDFGVNAQRIRDFLADLRKA